MDGNRCLHLTVVNAKKAYIYVRSDAILERKMNKPDGVNFWYVTRTINRNPIDI